jgi:multidrug efflux system membrane fusion protein
MRHPRLIHACLSLTLLALLVSGCHGKKKAAAIGQDRPAPLVVVQNVVPSRATYEIEAVGELEPDVDTQVPTKVSGIILKVHFQEGDLVEPGTKLVDIDPVDFAFAVKRSQAALSLAKSGLAAAEALALSAETRVTDAKAQVGAAEVEVASAEVSVKLAEADVVVAEATLKASATALAAAQAQQAGAVAQSSAAEANLKLAKDNLDRKTALKKEGYATDEDLLAAQVKQDTAQAGLQGAKAGVDAAAAACRQAEAQVTVAEARRDQARQAVEKSQAMLLLANAQVQLMKVRVEGAEAQVTAAKADIGRAKAGVEQAEAELGLAQQKLSEATVCAVVGGRVVARLVSPGEWTRGETAIARIVDDRTLKVRFTVPESEAGRLRPGMPARFTVKSLPGQSFESPLFFVSARADSSTRSVEAKARYDNAQQVLRAGGYCRVTVAVESRENAIVVPEAAVVPTEDGFVAYTLEGETARMRSVQIGLRSRGTVEVTEGLKAGDTLVVLGARSLSDGVKVRVTNDASSSGPEKPSPPPPAE